MSSALGVLLRRLLHAGPVYVRVRAGELWVRHVTAGREWRDEPLVAIGKSGGAKILAVGAEARRVAMHAPGEVVLANGFEHPRSLLADFTVAEKTLQHALREVFRGAWMRPAPILVVHPLERLEGGLTQVERRAWAELGTAAGARLVAIWVGRELADSEVRDMRWSDSRVADGPA